MITKEQITKIIQSYLDENQIFLVNIEITQGNRIMVYLDNEKGVTVKECSKISRLIEEHLNRDTEDYELEVSSPGLSEPLRIFPQYKKNVGREIEVLKKDGIKLTGSLLNANEEAITMEVIKRVKREGKKKKEWVKEEIIIDFQHIKSTKVVIAFK